jgi:hypothetical protein
MEASDRGAVSLAGGGFYLEALTGVERIALDMRHRGSRRGLPRVVSAAVGDDTPATMLEVIVL